MYVWQKKNNNNILHRVRYSLRFQASTGGLGNISPSDMFICAFVSQWLHKVRFHRADPRVLFCSKMFLCNVDEKKEDSQLGPLSVRSLRILSMLVRDFSVDMGPSHFPKMCTCGELACLHCRCLSEWARVRVWMHSTPPWKRVLSRVGFCPCTSCRGRLWLPTRPWTAVSGLKIMILLIFIYHS